ncbi:hypothetical protein B0H13DRAFT_1932723, partial [Mycena leptocephala]
SATEAFIRSSASASVVGEEMRSPRWQNANISDARVQNVQWEERESGESGEQTQTQSEEQTQRRKEGRGVQAAHPRGCEGAARDRKDGVRKASTAAFTASTNMGGTGAGMAGVRGGGARSGRGGEQREEGKARHLTPEARDASGCEKFGATRPSVVQKVGRTRRRERGAQRKGARALLAMYAELGPDVELETCGGVGRRPGAPGDDPTIWEARARWVAGKQDWLRMEDGKGEVYAEFMRSLSRALLPELGTRERGKGGRGGSREQEGKTAKRTWTYAS